MKATSLESLWDSRDHTCKGLKNPEIDFKASIPPAYVAGESIPGLLKKFTNTGSGTLKTGIENSEMCLLGSASLSSRKPDADGKE
jgi:hypothetical protein